MRCLYLGVSAPASICGSHAHARTSFTHAQHLALTPPLISALQAGVFANKGGGMRKEAKKMRKAADDMEAAMVDVRISTHCLWWVVVGSGVWWVVGLWEEGGGCW